MANTRFDDFHIADQLITSRGAKTCLLTCKKDRVKWIPEEPVVAPFGLSSYDELASRKSFDIRCNPELQTYFEAFDEWTVNYAFTHCERLFKKKLTHTEIGEMYKSPLNRKEGYQPLLKCKVNTMGNNAIRFWDADGEMTDEPTTWETTKIVHSCAFDSCG